LDLLKRGKVYGHMNSYLIEVLKEANKDFARLSINAIENTIYIIQKLGYQIIKEKKNG